MLLPRQPLIVPLSVAPPPKHPGTTIIRSTPEFRQAKENELAASKVHIGFQAGDIAVHLFESDEACLRELSSEYEEYLETPDKFSPTERETSEQGLAEWRNQGYVALVWPEEYWLLRDGRVIAS